LHGSDGFIKRWRAILRECEKEGNVKRERYAGRPFLKDIFSCLERDEAIVEAVSTWGYEIKEVGEHLNLH